jgi:hypothetical protein
MTVAYKIDKTVLLEKTLKSITPKIVKLYKKVIVCHNEIELDKEGIYIFIETDSPKYLMDEISSIINKSKHGMISESSEHEGFFDWASDTYIKPAVTFKVVV